MWYTKDRTNNVVISTCITYMLLEEVGILYSELLYYVGLISIIMNIIIILLLSSILKLIIEMVDFIYEYKMTSQSTFFSTKYTKYWIFHVKILLPKFSVIVKYNMRLHEWLKCCLDSHKERFSSFALGILNIINRGIA